MKMRRSPKTKNGLTPMKNRSLKNKKGFTLVEILVAMSLMGFLAVVMWTLFDTYRNLFEMGIDRSSRTRLARALTEQFSDDLHSAIQESSVGRTVSLRTAKESGKSWSVGPSGKNGPSNQSSSSQTTERTGSASDLSTEPSDQQPTSDASGNGDLQSESTDIITTRRFGLFGSSHTLRLDVLQVDPHYVYHLASNASIAEGENVGSLFFEDSLDSDASSAVGRAAELRTIEYTFVPKEEEEINAQVSEEDPLAETSLDPQEELEAPRRPGLIRRELSFDMVVDEDGNPMSDEVGIESIDPDESFDPNECYLPEVSDLNFRYYDGSGWTTSWDSLARRSLPVAVEITFKIETNKRKKRLGEQTTDAFEEQDAEVSEDATVGADVETGEVAYIDEEYENYQENLDPPEDEYRVLVTLPTSAKHPGVRGETDTQFETMPDPIAPSPLQQPTLQTPKLKTKEKSKPDERWMRSQK